MVAGVIQTNVTTVTGTTKPLSLLVDDTAAPTKWYGTSYIVDSTGASVIGDKTDAANTATGASPISLMSVTKQVSASVQALTAALEPLVAHGDTDSGSPYKFGMKAIAHGTNPTAVAAAARTNLFANRHGVPWVIGGHPNIITREHLFTDAGGAQTNAVLLGVAGGLKAVVTQISVVMDASNSVNVNSRVGFATTTLPVASAGGNNGVILSGSWAANCGQQKGNGAGIIAVGADGEDLLFTCDDPVGGAVRVAYSYYTIES